jgi:hypothetical protein
VEVSSARCRGATLPALLVGMALSTGLLAALITVSVQLVVMAVRVASEADFLATVAHSMEALATTTRSVDVGAPAGAITKSSPKPCDPGVHPVGLWMVDARSIHCASGLGYAQTGHVLFSSQDLPCEETCDISHQHRRLWYRRAYAWEQGDQLGALMVKEFDGKAAYGRAEMVAPGLTSLTGSSIVSAAGHQGVQLELVWSFTAGLSAGPDTMKLPLQLTLFPLRVTEQ